jgi:hypothetical protein
VWCDHNYPRWGEHTSASTVTTPPVLGVPASIMGRSFQSAWLRPFALPFAQWGSAQPTLPLPSLWTSKHIPSVNKSPIWSRKKSPILGMCSGPPWYYNPTIVKPDAPHPPPRNGDPAFLLLFPRPDALSPLRSVCVLSCVRVHHRPNASPTQGV